MLNARCINLFDKYEGFSYESLADVQQYLKPEDFIMLTDLKAGHHHLRLHPSTYRFLGKYTKDKYTTLHTCRLACLQRVRLTPCSWGRITGP